MIPLFKSHFSIGKSLLTLEKIFELADRKVILVEDNLSSLRKAIKQRDKTGKNLNFALRIEAKKEGESSKVIFGAKGDTGLKTLKKIYTKAFTETGGIFEIGSVDLEDVEVIIPFYDSFIHKSLHFFGDFSLPEGFLEKAEFIREENGHPFDYQIQKRLDKMGRQTTLCKSIFYEKNEHFPSFMCYKASCNRRAGSPPTFSRPELKAMCCDTFSFEEYEKRI